MKKMRKIIICGVWSILLLASGAFAQVNFLNWNDSTAADTNWPGWTWYSGGEGNGADPYGDPGWRKNDGSFYSGNTNWYPRSFQKRDYGNNNLAKIIITDRAPSTRSGGALKVYDTGESEIKQACWYPYLASDNLSTSHNFGEEIDRMDFYFKAEGMKEFDPEQPPWDNIHIGTYLCWKNGANGGRDCPYEASNQHYYHLLGINPGTWIHVVLDRHPQHQRGVGIIPDNNSFIEFGKHYYPNLYGFYVEIRYPQSELTSYSIDEIRFYSTKETEEPNQNDISIASVWVGYWQENDYWEIGFQDDSFGNGNYNNDTGSTFDIRWSAMPITNQNFESANQIHPMYHTPDGTLVWRYNNWATQVWTRFELPHDIEFNNKEIYFAVKDVSVKGEHKGPWPHNLGDGHDAPSSLIHTIDYSLPSGLITSVALPAKSIPQSIELSQNYPNPFNPDTVIRYELPFTARVTVKIYNILGKLVSSMNLGSRDAGEYQINWHGTDDRGQPVAGGIYYYQIRAISPNGKAATASKKMLLLK